MNTPGWKAFWLCVAVWNMAVGITGLAVGGFNPVYLAVLVCGLGGLPLAIGDFNREER